MAVSVSKAVGYGVLAPPPGVVAAKVHAYAVLSGLGTAAGALAPAIGPVAGGTAVTITGFGFTGPASVTFGGAAATDVVVVNGTTITCTAPAHAYGLVDVVVTTPLGAFTIPGAFTFLVNGPMVPKAQAYAVLAPPPGVVVGKAVVYAVLTDGPVDPRSVDSLTPAAAHTSGRVEVTIAGDAFEEGVLVLVDGAAVPATLSSADELVAVVPPHAAGAVELAVRWPDGTTRSATFTYEAAELTAVDPVAAAVGATVSVLGAWLFEGAVVRIGGLVAVSTWVSADELEARVPGLAPGTYDVEVVNAALGYEETLVLEDGLEVTAATTAIASGPILVYVVT